MRAVVRLLLVAILLLPCAACQCTGAFDHRSASPPPISHVVLVKLQNPADTAELIRDCNATLRGLPPVLTYACGPRLDSDRPAVQLDFDVMLVMGFADDAAYDAYQVHPDHVRILNTWKPRCASIRIYDSRSRP